MRLDLLRSKSQLDRIADSSEYLGYSGYRGAANDDDFIHNHFVFDDYPGEQPHARVSLKWADVEAIIDTFAKKGNPDALHLQRVRKLAVAMAEFMENLK